MNDNRAPGGGTAYGAVHHHRWPSGPDRAPTVDPSGASPTGSSLPIGTPAEQLLCRVTERAISGVPERTPAGYLAPGRAPQTRRLVLLATSGMTARSETQFDSRRRGADRRVGRESNASTREGAFCSGGGKGAVQRGDARCRRRARSLLRGSREPSRRRSSTCMAVLDRGARKAPDATLTPTGIAPSSSTSARLAGADLMPARRTSTGCRSTSSITLRTSRRSGKGSPSNAGLCSGSRGDQCSRSPTQSATRPVLPR